MYRQVKKDLSSWQCSKKTKLRGKIKEQSKFFKYLRNYGFLPYNTELLSTYKSYDKINLLSCKNETRMNRKALLHVKRHFENMY